LNPIPKVKDKKMITVTIHKDAQGECGKFCFTINPLNYAHADDFMKAFMDKCSTLSKGKVNYAMQSHYYFNGRPVVCESNLQFWKVAKNEALKEKVS
jgi:hypothetical protein